MELTWPDAHVVHKAKRIGLKAACALFLTGSAAAGSPPADSASAPAATVKVRVEYRKPENPAFEPLYIEMRDRRILERFQDVLSAMGLPRSLTLAFDSCGGEANAWYDPEVPEVVFCYAYLAQMRHRAATRPLFKVPQQDASDGPAVFVMLHEMGHAVFDLLQVPILGREEDAADAFATIVLLQFGKEEALRTLRGAAWSYNDWASTHKPDQGDLADLHALDAQRFYNILCLAYGSDPAFFAAAVTEKLLPADRAQYCHEEYQLALFAMQKLILPSVVAEEVKRLRIKRKEDWKLKR